MEEKRNMNEGTQEKALDSKVPYETLEGIAHQLSEQNAQLVRKLQEANLQNLFARLNYLFKVIEFASRFPADFVAQCVNEVVDTMTLNTSEVEQEEK